MDIYDFQEVKEKVPVSAYLESLGVTIKNRRFPAFWRDSTDLNCAISEDDLTWYDHVESHGGSVLDLALVAEGIPNMMAAAAALGQKFGLEPKHRAKKAPDVSKYNQLLEEGWKEEDAYEYTDEEGQVLYTVIRMRNPTTGEKTFLQRTPDHWGLANVRRVLLNLPAVIKSESVYIVEGEKDVRTLESYGLCATTNNGGSKNWDSDFDRYFQGKHVVILADNDAPGVAHAELVLREINDYAADIKVVTPSSLPKGDVTDYLTKEGGTIDGLMQIIDRQPYHDRQSASAANAQYTIEEARALNAEPFRNFYIEVQFDNKGRSKDVEKPVQVNNLVDECRRRFLDFPRRLGGVLFDRNLRTGEIQYLPSADSLMSWIGMRSKQIVEWAKIRGCVTQAQFFQAVQLSVRTYDGISRAPHVPIRPDIFYVHPPLPTLEPGAPSKLDELISKFSPADETYRILIKALFMAPMFFGANAPHPAWVIDSVDGKGVGKTTLVKLLAELYDETPIDIDASLIKTDLTGIVKRLISSEGRSRRIALLDNVQGTFRCANLARLVTASTVSGIAPYGRGEESRQNDITYIITSNAASLDDDIAQRAYTIKLRKSKRSPSWESDIRSFISRNRYTIFAEIVAALTSAMAADSKHTPATRYPEFEKTVLRAACGNDETYAAVSDMLLSDMDSANATTERAQEVMDVFRKEIESIVKARATDPDEPTFVTSAAVTHICNSSEILRSERISKSEILEMIQSGNLEDFSRKCRAIRLQESRSISKGVLWLGESTISSEGAGMNYINIITVEKDALVRKPKEMHMFREV